MSRNAPPATPICDDCTLCRCVGKKFVDQHGNVTAIGWRCTECGHRWMVPHRPPALPWYRRLIAWILEPMK